MLIRPVLESNDLRGKILGQFMKDKFKNLNTSSFGDNSRNESRNSATNSITALIKPKKFSNAEIKGMHASPEKRNLSTVQEEQHSHVQGALQLN